MTISRSSDELSIVCRAERVPPQTQSDHGWVCFQLIGPFAFDDTGIVLSVIRPLSEGGIGIFVVSTFDGDHVLIKHAALERATSLLREAGHTLI